MEYIENKYTNLSNTWSDINEHLPTLRKYASECESVIELGVRGCVSSWAFLCGLLHNNNNTNTKRLFLNDLTECNISELLHASRDLNNVEVRYQWINDLELEVEGTYDITFIDTWHIYGQLIRELHKYSKITNKYIIMHDTTVDGIYGETIRSGWDAVAQSRESGFPVGEINCGLKKAIQDFLASNSEWKLKEEFTNNNGLTVLERI